ncbi:GNAT family N-acetyltransferase [Sphingomonas crusticola]|uniref:GNAT family N-acetyltransferase n=1 Tax=Sphingomonas crusticola TaxID=1697973 RepID=UPI0013C36B75|nr:GNAT family N-acetyltransferase [Sphingomonas crusticola]
METVSDYRLVERVPTVAEHGRLRVAAGMTPRSAEAAAHGLPGTLLGVVIERDGVAVGMGRAIGDGGLFYQLVDIAVEPTHQARGLGKRIVGNLVERLRAFVPAEAYLSLIADGDAKYLYAQFGFEPTTPASIGMATWLNPPADDAEV